MKRDERGRMVFRSGSEWRKNTMYADTTVSTSKSQADIQRLLIDRFEASQVAMIERQGGQVAVAFDWQGRSYLIPVQRALIEGETVKEVAQTNRQAMRVLWWYLKSLLQMRFLMSDAELLLPYQMLDTPNGGKARLGEIVAGGLLQALPAPRGEVVDGQTRTL